MALSRVTQSKTTAISQIRLSICQASTTSAALHRVGLACCLMVNICSISPIQFRHHYGRQLKYGPAQVAENGTVRLVAVTGEYTDMLMNFLCTARRLGIQQV